MATNDDKTDHPTFGEILQGFRLRAGTSQSALAKEAGIDASYLNRIERGDREPPKRETVVALATRLRLASEEADRLLIAAGYLPRALAALGALDPTISLLAEVLADETLSDSERAELRGVVEAILRHWRGVR